MSKRSLAYSPPTPLGAYEPEALEGLRARSESGDVLGRIAEAGALKRASRGETSSRRITFDLSAEEHANLHEHARKAGLSMREVIRLALLPLLRKP